MQTGGDQILTRSLRVISTGAPEQFQEGRDACRALCICHSENMRSELTALASGKKPSIN
jgi:hypothetical protein